MSLPRYPEYQDSGVEWLGMIPAHWNVLSVRRGITFLTDFEANGSFADVKENVSLDSGEPFAWYVRATDLENSRFGMVEGNRFCDRQTYEFLRKTELTGGELLIAKRGEIGKVYLMPKLTRPATLGPNLHLIRLANNLVPEYVFRWFTSDYGNPQLVLADKSTTIGALYKDDIRDCLCLFPPLAEQQAIAEFLDRETTRIDTLIAKQEEMITLLQEKRKAIISHAVTRGLDPNVRLKHSGSEWLGMVPEHWDVKPLMRLTPDNRQIMYGIVLPGPNVDEGVPIVKGGDVAPGKLRLATLNKTTRQIEANYARSRLSGGDIVYAIRGSIGMVEIVPPELTGANLTQDAARVAPADTINNRWLLYALKSLPVFAQLDAKAIGATIRGINIRDLKRAILPVPTMVEQGIIAEYLDSETNKINTLIGKAKAGIHLLQEHRTSLISAAVTGKIDVRGLHG